MRIDYKIFYILLCLSAVLLIALDYILPPLVMKSFSVLEDSQVAKAQDGADNTLNSRVNRLTVLNRTVSSIGIDTLDEELVNSFEADFLAIVPFQEGSSPKIFGLSEDMVTSLVSRYGETKRRSGLLEIDGKPAILDIAKGESDYFIMGEIVDGRISSSLSTGDYFTLEKINSPVLQDVSYAKRTLIDKRNQDYVYAYSMEEDIFGKKAFYSKVKVPREIYRIGLSQIEIIFYVLVLGLVILMIAVIQSVKSIITNRLSVLVDSIKINRNSRGKERIVSFSGNDEIAVLSREVSDAFYKVEEGRRNLEREQSHLDSILRSMHDSVFIFDEKGRLSSSYILDVGGKGRHISSKVAARYLPKDVMGIISRAIKDISKDGGFKDVSYSLRNNGKKEWYDANISEKKDSKGRYDGVIMVARNVTDTKEMEKRMKEKMSELESLNKLMVGRELKMVELKKKIKELGGKI
jgi:hypothetical protein